MENIIFLTAKKEDTSLVSSSYCSMLTSDETTVLNNARKFRSTLVQAWLGQEVSYEELVNLCCNEKGNT